MEMISGYVYGAVGALIVAEMLVSLLPEGNMQKYVRVSVSIIVIIMLLIPLCRDFNLDISIDVGKTWAENEQKYEDIIFDVYNGCFKNIN